jgi:ABC-type glycerol-3-phosphate transport system substrate-binding protein
MKRFLVCIVVLSMLLIFTAGCGGSGKVNDNDTTGKTDEVKSQTSDEGTSENLQDSKNTEPVTIRFSHPASAEAEKEWVAEFKKEAEEKFPVNIEMLNIPGGELIKKITVMALSGDFIDLLAAQEVNEFAALKILMPLNERLDNDPDISRDDFKQSVLQAASIDGNIYALPTVGVGYSTMVNTKMLDETGMKLKDLKTWDDLLEAAKGMAKNGNYGYGWCGSDPRFNFRDFYVLASGNGLTFDKLDDPTNKQKFIELMEFYLKLKDYSLQNVESIGWPDLHKTFVDCKLGMIATGTYASEYLSGFDPEVVEYIRPIPVPTGPSVDKPLALVGTFGYGILNGSDNKDISWELLKLALEDKYTAKLSGAMHVTALKGVAQEAIDTEMEKHFEGHLPAKKDIVDRWNNIINNFGIPMPSLTGQTEIERVYQEKFFEMYFGRITSEQMYEQFIPEYQRIIKQYEETN